MTIRTILFDMDGVLFDYEGRVEQLTGKPFTELNSDEHYEVASTIGFFANLPLMEGALEMIEFVSKRYDVELGICSAIGDRDPSRVLAEKCIALKENIPLAFNHVIFVRKSVEKAKFASPHILLIDDRNKALNPFRVAGGNVIKHTSAEETIAALREFMCIPIKSTYTDEICKLISEGKTV